VVRRSDVDDPQLPLNDVIQQRYELIRPLVLLQDRTARQRARETDTHPETVGALKRRFEAQGMLGLLPETLQVGLKLEKIRYSSVKPFFYPSA